jgi:adenylosuccinate lyase
MSVPVERIRNVALLHAQTLAAQAPQPVRTLPAHGTINTHFGATLYDVTDTGLRWAQVVHAAGWALDSQIHALGDGAPWIAEQARLLVLVSLGASLTARPTSKPRGERPFWALPMEPDSG